MRVNFVSNAVFTAKSPVKRNVQTPVQNKKPVLNSGMAALAAYNRVNISFKGDSLGFEKFDQARQKAGISGIEEIEEQIKPENFLGMGKNSKVYSFSDPRLSNWAVKVDNEPNRRYDGNPAFRPVKDNFEGLNMGQEIAKIGDRYHILKKIEGVPHSVANWSPRIASGKGVTPDEALEFADSLEKISNFDQSAFDDYASQLKTLDSKGYKMDSVNPNNLLIDYDNGQIHIIDSFKKNQPTDNNSSTDLLTCILDFGFFKSYYDLLPEDKQEGYVENAKVIQTKCDEGAKKAGLDMREQPYLDFIGFVDEKLGWYLEDKGGNYKSRYDSMMDLLK